MAWEQRKFFIYIDGSPVDYVESSLEYTQITDSNEKIKPGQCNAACLKVTVCGLDSDVIGCEAVISYRPDSFTEGTYPVLIRGKVYNSEIQPNRNLRKLTIFDKMKEYEETDITDDYKDFLTYPKGQSDNYFGDWDVTLSPTYYFYPRVVKYDGRFYMYLNKTNEMTVSDNNGTPRSVTVASLIGTKTPEEIANSSLSVYIKELPDYNELGDAPQTVERILKEFVDYNIDVSDLPCADKTVSYAETDKVTIKDILSAAAECSGMYATIDPETDMPYFFKLGRGKDARHSIVDVKNVEYKKLESTYGEEVIQPYGRIHIEETNEWFGSSPELGTLTISNIFTRGGIQNIAEDIGVIVFNYSYAPVDLHMITAENLEPGEVFVVNGIDPDGTPGAWVASYNLENHLSGIQLIKQTVTARGKQNTTGGQSQLLRQVEQVLALSPAGKSLSERVEQVNDVLEMEDTSGTQTQQIQRAAQTLSLNTTAATGSAVLDDFDERITDTRDKLGITDGEPEPIRREITPTKYVRKYLYNVNSKSQYGPDNSYSYAIYDAKPGMTYYATGRTPSNTDGHPLITFYDSAGTILGKYGTDVNTNYSDFEVEAPTGSETIVVNSSSASQSLKLYGDYVLTGASVVDEITLDVIDCKDDINTLKNQVEQLSQHVEIGQTMTPTETVSGKLFNVKTKQTYSGSTYSYAVYDVTDLKYVFVTGASATNVSSYPLIGCYSENGTLLDSFGIEPATQYRDLQVELPAGSKTVVINSSMASMVIICKVGIVTDEDGGGADIGLLKNIADVRIFDAKKNPFQLAPLDKGYVTFVFDDLCTDLDSVASLFEQYNMPFGIAAIPDRLGVKATYLQTARGNFTPGMTMQEICDQVVANGGEIMTHNSSPIVTAETQWDDEFMKGYFCTSKQTLENAGFTVRGLIRAGGTGAISGTKQIERWLTIGGYEYSNIGTAENYNKDRTTINKTQTELKNAITAAYTNQTWLRFMCHSYTFDGGQTFTGEADLIELLEHCQTLGIPVVTYAYIFDHFSSSLFLNSINS